MFPAKSCLTLTYIKRDDGSQRVSKPALERLLLSWLLCSLLQLGAIGSCHSWQKNHAFILCSLFKPTSLFLF